MTLKIYEVIWFKFAFQSHRAKYYFKIPRKSTSSLYEAELYLQSPREEFFPQE